MFEHLNLMQLSEFLETSTKLIESDPKNADLHRLTAMQYGYEIQRRAKEADLPPLPNDLKPNESTD